MKLLYALLGVVVVICMTACSEDPTSTDTIVVVRPNVGSYYVIELIDETLGSAADTSSGTANIVATDMNVDGRTGVVALLASQSDTTFFRYEDNGDVEIAESRKHNWKEYNFASKTSRTWYDTVLTSGGTKATIFTNVMTHLGTESITVKGKSIPSMKVEIRRYGHTDSAGGNLLVQTLWFAHSIGHFTKATVALNDTNRTAIIATNIQSNLTDYEIK